MKESFPSQEPIGHPKIRISPKRTRLPSIPYLPIPKSHASLFPCYFLSRVVLNIFEWEIMWWNLVG